MLYEKTTYLNDFPINIRVAKVKEYPLHYHHDVEFVYVLRGEIKLKNGTFDYLLKEGDIFTSSGHEVHGLYATDKDNVVAVIQVSNWFFTQYFPTLNKACFRTFVNKDRFLQMDDLRQLLLRILLDYLRKSFNYKNQCTFMMIETIEYLNKNFNLFSFEDEVVVNFKDNNPVTVSRISRIITYIFENHAQKITLDTLAQQEHLSSFYLSHLIKEYVGISFQEFLCYARVEMSLIPLLETDKKISTIAKDVGFSTTAYYNKYFEKWFGHSPIAHRQQFQTQIFSTTNQPKLDLLSPNPAINLVKRCLSAIDRPNPNPTTVRHLQLSIAVEPEKAPIMELSHRLEVTVTPEDYQVLGKQFPTVLKTMAPSKVLLSAAATGETGREKLHPLKKLLETEGFSVDLASDNDLTLSGVFGYDTIAGFFHVFKEYFLAKERPVSCRLRDQGPPEILLKGCPSCFTSGMLPKPSYYAYQLLRSLRGSLLYWGKYYSVIKTHGESDSYILLGLHFNDEIERLCLRNAGIYETNDIIGGYIDEISLDFDLPLTDGTYSIIKYAFTNENTIFNYMAQLGFPEKSPLSGDWLRLLNTLPSAQGLTETVADGKLSVSLNMRGAAVQVAVITPAEREEIYHG